MRWLINTLGILVFLFPNLALASNVGIVNGLWYDTENILADVPTRIYVAVRNNTKTDFTGTVEFFVNDNSIGKNPITAAADQVIDSWIDWQPSYGTSTIKVVLSHFKATSNSRGTDIITNLNLAEDTIFVDKDTDQDGIGDQTDTDDDGDGISDKEEIEAGTNPLIYDSPIISDTNTTDDNNKTEPGLEQFTNYKPIGQVLGVMTNNINDLKENLDDYREQRQARLDRENGIIEVNEDGFGYVERISKKDQSLSAEKPPGFFGDFLTFFGNVFSILFTVVLAALSFILGFPVITEIVFLLGILFILYRIAKRLGSRPY